MKKLFLLWLLGIPMFLFAQTGSLTIFSENDDKFTLYLDGVKQNEIACSNIRIQELPDLYYSAKIVFESTGLAPVSKSNLYLSDGEDIMRDAAYRLRREKTGKAKLSFYSMTPVQKNFAPPAGMNVFHFGESNMPDTILAAKLEISPVIDSVHGRGSLTVFSPNGDKFFLYLDGTKQNDTAQSAVRINDIPGLYYNARIVFSNPRIAPISKNNLYISDGDDVLMNVSYRIRRDKTGRPRLNFYSMQPEMVKTPVPAGMFVYRFGEPAKGTGSPLAIVPKKAAAPVTGHISNIRITDPNAPKPVTGKSIASNRNKPAQKATASTAVPVSKKAIYIPAAENIQASSQNTSENKKCNGWPMGKGDLDAAKKIVAETANEEEKLTVAQQSISSNCLLASQVAEFCRLFKSEKSKVAFAKYAYKFTIDRKNFSEVNKAFTLEASRKELNKFINGG